MLNENLILYTLLANGILFTILLTYKLPLKWIQKRK
jgi:hypothetical protein